MNDFKITYFYGLVRLTPKSCQVCSVLVHLTHKLGAMVITGDTKFREKGKGMFCFVRIVNIDVY